MRDDQRTSQVSPSHDRNGLLDLLRFAAAMMVTAYHFLYRGARDGGYLETSYAAGDHVTLGYLGVNLFFLISGFVIIWSASGRDWYSFSVGRLTRLYPAHLVAMTITFLVMSWWAQAPFTTGFGVWLANLTMLAPAFGQPFMDGAYWSIVIELIFYFWIVVGLFSGVLPRHTDGAIAVWMVFIVTNNLILGSRPIELVLLTEYGAYFALGAMVWRISSHGSTRLRLFLAGLALMMTFHAAEMQRLDVIARLGEASTPAMVALANAGIIGVFLLAATLGRFVKSGPLIVALGGISYPLYLVHQNAGYIVINLTAPAIGKWAAFVLATAMALAISWWIYRHVEPVGRRIIRTVFSPASRYLPRTGSRFSAPAE